MPMKPKTRVLLEVGGVLLAVALIAAGLLYAAWSTIVPPVGVDQEGSPAHSSRVGFATRLQDGRVEFDLEYGREVVGVNKFAVSEPGGKPLWVLTGSSGGRLPKIVYGKVPVEPGQKWTQEFPEGCASPVDIRGKTVKVQVDAQRRLAFGLGRESSEGEVVVPKQ